MIKKSFKNTDRNEIEHDRPEIPAGPGSYGTRFLRAGPGRAVMARDFSWAGPGRTVCPKDLQPWWGWVILQPAGYFVLFYVTRIAKSPARL